MSEDMFATSQADNRLGLSDVTPWARTRDPQGPNTPAPAGDAGISAVRETVSGIADNVDHRLNEKLQQRQATPPDAASGAVSGPESHTAPSAVADAPHTGTMAPQNEIHPAQVQARAQAVAQAQAPDVRLTQPTPSPAPAPTADAPASSNPRPSFQLPRQSDIAPAGVTAGGPTAPAREQSAPHIPDPAPQMPDPVPHPDYRPAPAQPAQPAAYTFRQPARPAMETMQVPAVTTPHMPPAHSHSQVPAMHTTYLQAADDDLFNLLETLDNRVTSMEQAISDLRRTQPAADGSMLRPVEKAVQRLSERLDRLDGGNQQQIGYDDETIRSRPQKRRKGGGLVGGLLDVFKR